MEQSDSRKNLKDLEMAKKRNHKIMITDEAIKKVPRIQYKNIPESEYNTIQILAKSVLQISKDKNDSNEVDPISNTTAYHLVSSAKECIVIVLHNHPSLSDFSLSDVQFLLRYASVKMMVAVTNLGSISYLAKGKGYSYERAVTLFNEAVSSNNEAGNLKGVQRAADHFLKNCYEAGIDYDNR